MSLQTPPVRSPQSCWKGLWEARARGCCELRAPRGPEWHRLPRPGRGSLHCERAGGGGRCPYSSLACTRSAPGNCLPASRLPSAPPGLCHPPEWDVPGLALAQIPTSVQRIGPTRSKEGRSRCWCEQISGAVRVKTIFRLSGGCFRKDPETRR